MGINYILVLEKEIGVTADIFPTVLLKSEEVFAPIYAAEKIYSFRQFERQWRHQWFDPADGLQTVRGCLRFLRLHPDHVETLGKQEHLFQQHMRQEAIRYYESLPPYHQIYLEPILPLINRRYQRRYIPRYHPDSVWAFIDALQIVEEVLVAAQKEGVGFYFWTTLPEANEEENWCVSDSENPGKTEFSRVDAYYADTHYQEEESQNAAPIRSDEEDRADMIAFYRNSSPEPLLPVPDDNDAF